MINSHLVGAEQIHLLRTINFRRNVIFYLRR